MSVDCEEKIYSRTDSALSMTDATIVLVAKFPSKGVSKTRLYSTLGVEKTFFLAKAMLSDLLNTFSSSQKLQSRGRKILYTPAHSINDANAFCRLVCSRYDDWIACPMGDGTDQGILDLSSSNLTSVLTNALRYFLFKYFFLLFLNSILALFMNIFLLIFLTLLVFTLIFLYESIYNFQFLVLIVIVDAIINAKTVHVILANGYTFYSTNYYKKFILWMILFLFFYYYYDYSYDWCHKSNCHDLSVIFFSIIFKVCLTRTAVWLSSERTAHIFLSANGTMDCAVQWKERRTFVLVRRTGIYHIIWYCSREV